MDAAQLYDLGELLHESPYARIRAAVRRTDGRQVVLKTYMQRAGSHESAAEQEFTALRKAAGPGVVEALELVLEPNQTSLVLERVRGLTLRRWVEAQGPLPATSFLEVAIQLASALSRVHAARLIHRAVKPANVVVDPERLGLCLIDFSLARPLGSAAARGVLESTGERIATDFVYISPEQTGRMDRGLDSRSDLYSLGATLYFALTGQPPFPEDDPLALVHAHLARRPESPLALRRELPGTLARIVLRLLEKSPEERYQMAGALQRDLVRCKEEFEATGRIHDELALGSADAPYCPIFSHRLYGRSEEVDVLLASYDEATAGRPVVLLLEGEAGIGKSALAQELRPAVARSRGYLAQGSFDLSRRDQPYLGVALALQSLVQQLLTESDARLKQWRQKLAERLGVSASALADVVPDLRYLLEDVPLASTLGALEARLRLSLAIQRLIQVVATPEHPLVLLLDDMQWADAGSHDLLSDLLRQPTSCALLVVLAYRDRELEASHPLRRLHQSLSDARVPVHVISLRPLGEEACAAMLADALGRSAEAMRSLATCVGRKTGNAPLLIQQFVYHLYDERLLQFDPDVGWSWDENELVAAEIPESALGMITARISRLDPAAAQVLELASCVGHEFELDLLRELSHRQRDEVESALSALCDEGLVARTSEGYRFVHDRIREAVQTLLSLEQRAQLHARVADLLLEGISAPELDQRVFEIADHLKAAAEGGVGLEPRRALEIHVRACRRALAAGAGATALHYFRAAQAQFDDALWQSEPGTCFELFVHGADAAHQCEQFAKADQCLAALAERPLSQTQRVQVLARQIRSSTLTSPRRETANLTLQMLRRFGVRWSLHPSRLKLWWDLLRTDWSLRRSHDGTVLPSCPPRRVDRVIPALLFQAGGQSLSMMSYRSVLLGAAFTTRLYATFGYLTSPSMSLAAYGAYQMRFPARRRRALRYLQAARHWNQQHPTRTYGPRSEMVAIAYGDAWVRPRQELVDPLRKVSARASEEGDFEYACLSDALRVTLMAFSGYSIPEFKREREQVAWTNWAYAIGSAHALGSRVFTVLSEGANLDQVLGEIARAESAAELQVYTRLQMMIVLVVLGEHARAFAAAEDIRVQAYRAQIGTQIVDFSFLRGWAAAAYARSAAGAARAAARRALKESLRDLRRWSPAGSDFVHMHRLLEAERLRSRGEVAPTLALYVRAAGEALDHGHRHHAALAHEARAELLADQRRSSEARTSLRQAMMLYEEWGAVTKAERLAARLAEERFL